MAVFYAKSKDHTGSQTTVKEHHADVALLCRQYADAFGQGDPAALCGQLHDFGKYSIAFQDVLAGKRTGIDHAVCGAAFLHGLNRPELKPIEEAIAAHHSSLHSSEDLEPVFREILKSSKAVTTLDRGKEAALSGNAQFLEAVAEFKKDSPKFRFPKPSGLIPSECLRPQGNRMLHTRMLFSCLVDADYTVSSSEPPEEGPPLDAVSCLVKLNQYYDDLKRRSQGDSKLNQLRSNLFEQCGKAGEQDGGLFTLTAPTGTGKTLALLHFALRHCCYTRKRRIIVVLPFLSLVEQSTAEYAKIVPNILEDHSQANLPEELREHSARWDQPFIITTSVRFFESLFADKPTDCRKLHNIADSVVLFDEAQSLPLPLTQATLSAVNQLCSQYRCTMVFSTATQPAFQNLQNTAWCPREILPDFRTYYDALRRYTVTWKLEQLTPFPELAKKMEEQTNICTIVNLRAHARQLFLELKARCSEDEIYLLSTDLCPAHRTQVIASIKQRQKQQLPCRVVSTQCIEAGVDLDFDFMYRALGPMEAIVQAAGRCNRNGRNPNAEVTVFIPESSGRLYPDDHYANSSAEVKAMRMEKAVDIQNPDSIAEYYKRLFCPYRGDQKSKALEKAISEVDYGTVAKEYKLIAQSGIQVIVPYGAWKEEYEALRAEALSHGLTGKLIHRAAPLTVTCFDAEKVQKLCEPLIFAQRDGSKLESGFFILRSGMEHQYSEKEGLILELDQSVQDFVF